MQLDLFPPPPEPIPSFNGWLRCPCDLVFWIYPLGTDRTTDRNAPPDLRPFKAWTCWRGMRRMTPRGRHESLTERNHQ